MSEDYPTITGKLAPIAKCWAPTYELRWLAGNEWRSRALQQKFVCLNTGEEEWRDIPTVGGNHNTSA